MSFHPPNRVATLGIVAALCGFAVACNGAQSRHQRRDGNNPVSTESREARPCTAAPVPAGVAAWSDALGTALEESPLAALASLEATLQAAHESAEQSFDAAPSSPSEGSGDALVSANSPQQAAQLRAWFGTWVQTPWPLLTLDSRGFVLADAPACAVLAAAMEDGPESHQAAIEALEPWLRAELRPESSCVRACSAR